MKAALVLLGLTLPRDNRKGDCKSVNGAISEGFPVSENPLINIILVLMLLNAITEV